MNRSVDRILQSLAALELRGLGSLDGEGLACVRVDADSGCSLADFESAKANQLDLAALCKLFSYCICESLEGLLSFFLCKSGSQLLSL